jgi:hypothetical protein
MSEPNSLRLMENILIDRNGGAAVRPGLRYLTFSQPPDLDPMVSGVPGKASDLPIVGSHEPFFLPGGERALLYAVREVNGSVGFRVLLFSGSSTIVYRLTDPQIGFRIPQGEGVLNFSAGTKHVSYLQINNRIVAMSDNGESVRLFVVNNERIAKKLLSITTPDWSDGHKLTVRHPDSTWILKQTQTTRNNMVRNSGFQLGSRHWVLSPRCGAAASSHSGRTTLAVQSLPARTNMQSSPLHDVESTGVAGWHSHQTWGKPRVTADKSWMRVSDAKGKGLFLAYGARLTHGVAPDTLYQVALDYEIGSHIQPVVILTFYGADGIRIGSSTVLEMPKTNKRYASQGVRSPVGTASMRVSIGGRNEHSTSTWIRAKNVVLCREDEVTTMFHGGSGTHYSWVGTANASPSVYHPPTDITITCGRVAVPPNTGLGSSLWLGGAGKAFTLDLRRFDKSGVSTGSPATLTGTVAGATVAAGHDNVGASTVLAEMSLKLTGMARGEIVHLDEAMIEPLTATAGPYFDGNSPAAPKISHGWVDRNAPFDSHSYQNTSVELSAIPVSETPTANTLIATGTAAQNPYKMGFFYTFENEVGESMASKITEVRVSRPWSNWRWETPNAAGEPSGTKTENPDLSADQLACIIPEAVYNQAIAEGAVKWNLYVFAWSDQEPVPVVALLAHEKDLYTDRGASLVTANALAWADGGMLVITPQRRFTTHDSLLPTRTNRVNYSRPPGARAGLVAGDRLILVGDPADLASIRWTSNRMGDYLNLTASKGGGVKTLTTGNMRVPNSVVLWQNPQSVDTLTILCGGGDGETASYYMNPASVTSQSSGITAVMGFEETTSTPGTTSPWGAQVVNNALYRPLDRGLLKSTAQNYNINHKAMSEKIANQWLNLEDKALIISAVLDNRIYYVVHNPAGAVLEPGCKGNEIWVLDLGIESNPWSRFMIQASAVRPVTVGPMTYIGVSRPDGLYYLDARARLDHYVSDNGEVLQRPISWMFETNTQGANRAHDAWAHLQQVGLTLGNFKGSVEYGVRGWSLHGTQVDVFKRFTDDREEEDHFATFDVEDFLLIRRDMKEWFFYARSVPEVEGSGLIGLVQYRYTPVSVNVGYEFGSVESFEYGANVAGGNTDTMANGIPRPYIDQTRP